METRQDFRLEQRNRIIDCSQFNKKLPNLNTSEACLICFRALLVALKRAVFERHEATAVVSDEVQLIDLPVSARHLAEWRCHLARR